VRTRAKRRHWEQRRHHTTQLPALPQPSAGDTPAGLGNALGTRLDGSAQGNSIILIEGEEKLRHDKLTSFLPKLRSSPSPQPFASLVGIPRGLETR